MSRLHSTRLQPPCGDVPRRKSSLIGIDDVDLQIAIQQSLRDVAPPSATALSSALGETAAALQGSGAGNGASGITAMRARRASLEASEAMRSLASSERRDSDFARQLQAEEDSLFSAARPANAPASLNCPGSDSTRRGPRDSDFARQLQAQEDAGGDADLASAIGESYCDLGCEVLGDRDALVHKIYEREGLDILKIQERLQWFLKSLNLAVVEVGSVNLAGERELINQCFYLALARSYLGPSPRVHSTALVFKQLIEGAVLSKHPEWLASGEIGEEVKAFSDLLTFPMQDVNSHFACLAVVVVDSVSGCIEIFKGVSHKDETPLLIWYIPGHYQCLSADDPGRSMPLLDLTTLKRFFDREGLAYVETCG